MNQREGLVTSLHKSDEFCWPLGNYFDNLLFLCSIISATDWCHLLCSPRTTHSSSRTDLTLLPSSSWQPQLACTQIAALLLVLEVHAADSVWVSLTHVQAITGEIAELTMEVSNRQSHCSSSKQKAMLQVTRLQNNLPRKGDNYLLIAASYKLTLEGVSCQEIAEFRSTEKKEWERCWISHCSDNLFLLSVWCTSFTLATWNVCAL